MLGDAAAEADGQTSVPNEVELSDDEQEDVIRANDTICLACDNGGKPSCMTTSSSTMTSTAYGRYHHREAILLQHCLLPTPKLLPAFAAGDVIQCDGACNAVFHFGKCHERGFIKGFCNPLQMPQKLAERCFADNIPWTCPSCFASVHQCYVCKQEGRAEASGGPQEVFRYDQVHHAACICLQAGAISVSAPDHQLAFHDATTFEVQSLAKCKINLAFN